MDPVTPVEDKPVDAPPSSGQALPAPVADETGKTGTADIAAAARTELSGKAVGETDGGGEPDFLTALKAEGFEHSFQDAKSAAKSYVELRNKLAQRDQLAQLGQTVLPHYNKFVEWQKAQEQAKPAAKEKPLPWDPPHQFNPVWLTEMQKEEAERNPVVANQLNEYLSYTTQKWQDWMFNPNKMVEELVGPAIEARISGLQEEMRQRETVTKIVEANRELCEKYNADITQVLQAGGRLEDALRMAQMADELAKLKAGTPAGQASPAAPNRRAADVPGGIPSKTVPAAGVVTQKPAAGGAPTDDDVRRWADPRQAIRDAALAFGDTELAGSI